MRRSVILLLLLSFAALVATGCGAYGTKYTEDTAVDSTTSSKHQITSAKFTADAREKDGCTEVKTFPLEGRGVAQGDVTYKQNPPSSGKHAAEGLEYGVYSKEEPTEKWVHNLEYGHIVVTYKGIADTEVTQIKNAVKRAPYHLVVLPRKDNPKDGVYYTAWLNQIYCEHPSKAALQEMVTEFLDKGPVLVTSDKGKDDKSDA